MYKVVLNGETEIWFDTKEQTKEFVNAINQAYGPWRIIVWDMDTLDCIDQHDIYKELPKKKHYYSTGELRIPKQGEAWVGPMSGNVQTTTCENVRDICELRNGPLDKPKGFNTWDEFFEAKRNLCL